MFSVWASLTVSQLGRKSTRFIPIECACSRQIGNCGKRVKPGSVLTKYSLAHFLSNFPDFFLYLDALECSTTSDWINHAVKPIKICVTFQFANFEERA